MIDECDRYGEGKSAFFDSQIANINPFATKEETDNTRHSTSVKNIIGMHYISEDIFYSFKFKLPVLKEECKNKYAMFYISYHPNNGVVEFDSREIRLCSDGYLHKLERDDFGGVLFFNSRELAHEIMYRCKEQLFENHERPVFSYFSVNIIGISKPEHLFTKKEIEFMMKEADDRVNNTLVIDEEGYARIVCNNELDIHSFPVHHEKWNAGNLYAGKYSNLSTLEETYLSSLQGWLRYLQTKRSNYVDYLGENQDEQQLNAEIRKA